MPKTASRLLRQRGQIIQGVLKHKEAVQVSHGAQSRVRFNPNRNPQRQPYPSVEEAYGMIQREAARLKIMPPASPKPTVDAGVGSADASSGEIGYRFGAQRNRSMNHSGPPRPTTGAAHRPGSKPDKSKLWCLHCGMQRHTRGTCFQRVGYLEWWDEKQKARAQAKLAVGVNEGGRRTVAPNREGAVQSAVTPPKASTGTGDNIRVGNFVERREATGNEKWQGGGANCGGKGFGITTNPNNFHILQFSPSNSHKLCEIPHCLHKKPPRFEYL